MESGKDQNFPEGEPLNVLVLSLLLGAGPMSTRWHPLTHPEPMPWEPAPGMAPTLRHPGCRKPCWGGGEGRQGECGEGSDQPAEAQEASQSGASKARPEDKEELPQVTRQKQEGAQGRLPLSLRIGLLLHARSHSLKSDLGKLHLFRALGS